MAEFQDISVTEITGFHIGSAEDITMGTGVTTIISEDGATAGVDVRGGGPATRETDLLTPENMVEKIHAVVLSGGSAFGLEAASGVMDYLAEKGYGFDTGVAKVPIVCGASLFDLHVRASNWKPDSEEDRNEYGKGCRAGVPHPNKAMGRDAAGNAFAKQFRTGNYGAGTGATVGKYKGPQFSMKTGQGASAIQIGSLQVGAIAAVNALGDVIDSDGSTIAGMLNESYTDFASTSEAMKEDVVGKYGAFKGNTTISCILTNGILTKAQCRKLASIAHDAYARTIRPVHTSADGDTIFVMSTGTEEVNFDALSVIATEELEKAIRNAAREAQPAYGMHSARSIRK